MNIDIGTGQMPYGDIGFTYVKDEAFDRFITAYDSWLAREFGIVRNPGAKVYTYRDEVDIENVLEQLNISGAVALFKHSLEHTDCPINYLRAVKRFSSTIIIITPNAATNNADSIDHTHVYAWLNTTMRNMLDRALGLGWVVSERVDVEREVSGGRDLVFTAVKT